MMRRANKCFNITDDKTRTVDIDRLLERVAAKSLDKVRPTKGEFNQTSILRRYRKNYWKGIHR
jgi:hypothetical protein